MVLLTADVNHYDVGRLKNYRITTRTNQGGHPRTKRTVDKPYLAAGSVGKRQEPEKARNRLSES
jgi:hypothetical protein